MKLNKPLKIFIGILTGFSVVFPFVIGPGLVMWMVYSTGFPFLDQQSVSDPRELTRTLVPMMMVFYPVMICFSFMQLALQITYMVHEVLNKSLTDTFRILFILGTFFMPFIAMPIYFIAYLWKADPLESDLEKGSGL